MSLLEPWILFRLVAGLVACLCLGHAAWIGLRVLRFSHLASTAEGQLSLERQAELGATSARVGAVLQMGALLLSVLSADRLTSSIKGAMCGYGVVDASPLGWWAMGTSLIAALAAGVLLQLLGLDARTRSLSLLRPVAKVSVGVAALAIADLGATFGWLSALDFSVVASCCSSGLDDAPSAVGAMGGPAGARLLFTSLAALSIPLAAGWALLSSRRPARWLAVTSGLMAALALVASLGTIPLEVAPHVFETPHHRCIYCLFKPEALFLGYPLLGALLLGAVWGMGSAAGALLSKPEGAEDPFVPFARQALRREAAAWLLTGALCALPVVRYAIVTGGLSLFP